MRLVSDLISPCQKSNDFYLVEYPKSGITWLTVLLANICLIEGKENDRATFSSVRSYIPDLHVSKKALAYGFSKPRVQFYKSHATFHPEYVNIIYLARHPSNVMASHFHFRRNLGHFDGSFEDFCFRSRFGVNEWKEHVKSWFSYPHNSNQRFIHLVRYEDLLADAEAELLELSKNFGWSINAASAEEAVSVSAREQMLQQETRYRERNPAHSMQFVSAGSREDIPSAITERITDLCAPEMKLLGY